jgi:hypothetical protein
MIHRKRATLVALTFAAVLLAACATIAPGEDPVVVHTQQTLAVGQLVYDSAMSWAKANAGSFSAPGLASVNTIRVSFPPAYRALDAALDAYKAGKVGDYATALERFQELVGQLTALVTSAGGPDIKAAAVAQAGGVS